MPFRNDCPSKPPSRRHGLPRGLGALFLLMLAAVPAVEAQNAAVATSQPGLLTAESPAPERPSAVLEIVEVHPFRLRTPYRHDWSADRPLVSSGLLVVLKVDPVYVVPRNAGEPILYAGEQTVQRLNHGHRSGYVVGLVPGEPDLSAGLLWFGRPGLPGWATPETIAEEKALAESAGIKAFQPDQVERALGEAVEEGDVSDLLRGLAADLVLKYSPDERDLAATWRLPTVGPATPR